MAEPSRGATTSRRSKPRLSASARRPLHSLTTGDWWTNRPSVSCGNSKCSFTNNRLLHGCLPRETLTGAQAPSPAPPSPPRLEPGARVRLDASSLGRITGTLVALETDTLVVREDGQAEGLNASRRGGLPGLGG